MSPGRNLRTIRPRSPIWGLGEKIINSTSVTDRRGSPHLIDHASTKSAIVSITRSLAQHLKERKVRVNAVRRVRSGRL
jgi:NAD(P)-dependent dehydrogenase (short-subunit alcohol dehydrogenase family)